MHELTMEIRRVDTSERLVVGVAVPYGEISYLAGDPAGERFTPGSFHRSIEHRGDKVPLLDNHIRERVMGYSQRFDETETELAGSFKVNEGADGDRLLEDLAHGYYSGMSVGFLPMRTGRADDGVREIREAKLVEVSLVGIPAYEGAGVLAVRNAQDLDRLLAPFLAPPAVNLDPIPPLPYR